MTDRKWQRANALISSLTRESKVEEVQKALHAVADVDHGPGTVVCRVCVSYRNANTRNKQGGRINEFGNIPGYKSKGNFYVSFSSAVRHPSVPGRNRVYKFYMEAVSGVPAGHGGAGIMNSHACSFVVNKDTNTIYVFDPNHVGTLKGTIHAAKDFVTCLKTRYGRNAAVEVVDHDPLLNANHQRCRYYALKFLLGTRAALAEGMKADSPGESRAAESMALNKPGKSKAAKGMAVKKPGKSKAAEGMAVNTGVKAAEVDENCADN